MPFWKCAVVAFLAIPRCGCAEGDSLSPEQLHNIHSKMDVDSNGKVSLDEVLLFSDTTRKLIAGRDIKTALQEMDNDTDGHLSLDELLKDLKDMEQWHEDAEDKKKADARIAVKEKQFKAADANGDGVLSEVELPALFYPETHEGVLQIATQSTMEQKDIDKDGLLTFEEFWKDDQVEGEEIAAQEMTDFKKLDKDGSGKLDLEELKAWESGRFHTIEAMQKFMEAADKDNDLHVTSEEIAAAHSTIAGSDAHHHFSEWAEHHEL